MKYSNRYILNALNENIYMKHDMKEQYKFSELPILKHMSGLLYNSDTEYQKISNRFRLIRGHQLQLSNYLPETIQTVINNMKIVKYGTRFTIQDRTFDVYMYFDETKRYMHHHIDEHFKKVYMWLYIASRYASPTCSKSVSYTHLTLPTSDLV